MNSKIIYALKPLKPSVQALVLREGRALPAEPGRLHQASGGQRLQPQS